MNKPFVVRCLAVVFLGRFLDIFVSPLQHYLNISKANNDKLQRTNLAIIYPDSLCKIELNLRQQILLVII